MAQLIKKASKGASIYVNGTKKDLTPEQWDAFKAEFGNNPEMISYFTDENNTSSFRMNDNGTITVNGMPLSTDSRKRRAKRTDDANTEKLYNFFNGLSTTIKGKNIMNYAGDYNLGYDASEDGKTHTLNRAAVNANAMKRLDALVNFDPNSWDTIEGFENFSDKTALKNYVDQYVKPNYEYLKAALTNGATKEDFKKYKDIFNSIGIYADKKSSGSEGDSTKPAAGTSAGIIGDYIVHDGNGGFRFSDAYSGLNTLISDYLSKNKITHGNLWFNNDFKKFAAKNNFDVSWIPEDTGLFRINGKYVLGSNIGSLTGNDKVAFDNWVADNKSTINGSNDRFVQYWDTYGPYLRNSNTDGNYQNALGEGDYYIDQTGYYRLPNGQSLYQVADKDYRSNDANYGLWGHLKRDGLKYILVDANGNLVSDNVDLSQLTPEDDKTKIEKYYTTGTGSVESLATEGGNYLNILRDAGVGEGGYGLLQDPTTGRYYWLNRNWFNNHADFSGRLSDVDSSTHAMEIDPRMAKYIFDNWDEIINDGSLEEIQEVMKNPWTARLTFVDDGWWWNKMWSKKSLKELMDELQRSGFNFGDKNYKAHGGNKVLQNYNTAKQLGHLIKIVPSSTSVESKQHGGTIYKPKEVTVKHEKPINSPERKPGEAKTLGDGTDLSTQDWAEIAALGADLGSAVLAFVPGANIASAGVGAAGSVTDFIAQATKDGLDWGDVGRLALNLGLDAATLIPFAGGAAKAAKIANAIRKSKPLAKAINWIAGTASAIGAGRGIATAYENIVNGDDWTIEDIRTIVNGIRGITNLNNLRGSAVKKGEVTDSTVGTIGKDKNIKITKKEYDEIMDLPNDQQAKKMAELIKSKTTDEKILKRLMTKEEAEKAVEKVLGKRPDNVEDQKAWDELVSKKQEETVDRTAEEILKELGIKLKKQKAETTWNPKTWDFWHRGGIKGNAEFKPGPDVLNVYRKPDNWDDLDWWDQMKYYWNRRAARRYRALDHWDKLGRKSSIENKWMSNTPVYVSDATSSGYDFPWLRSSHKLKLPITVNTYHNLLPWFTRDENVIENPDLGYYKPTVYYKKGGKVLKGEKGLPEITADINSSILGSLEPLQTSNPFGKMFPSANDDPFFNEKLQADLLYDEALSEDDTPINNEFYNNFGSAINQAMEGRAGKQYRQEYKAAFGKKWTPVTQTGEHTTSLKSNLFQDIGKGLVDTGRLALNLASAKNQEKKMAEAIKASRVQYEMPNLIAPRYDNSSVEHLQSANRNAIAQQRLSLPKTSDSNRNFAMQQSIASNESKARAQENMAYSQTQSAFNKMNNEFQNKAASLRADVVTKQRAEDARVASALKANEAKGQAQRDASIDAYLTQLSTDQRNFQHARRQAQANNELMEYSVKHQNDFNAIYEKAKQRALQADPKLKDDPNKLDAKIYADEQFKQEYTNLNNIFAAKKASASNYAYDPILWRYESFPGYVPSTPGGTTYLPDTITSSKNGGKLSYMQKVDLEGIKNAHKLQQENRKAFLKKMIKEDEQLYKVLLKLVK